jgi:hypothetical protein
MSGEQIDTLSGGVEYGVGNGRRHTHQFYLSYTVRSKFINNGIVFLHKKNVQLLNISLNRNMILCQVLIYIFSQIKVTESGAMPSTVTIFDCSFITASVRQLKIRSPSHKTVKTLH